ncbi:MAG: PT domain-containing protein [Clostridia bacterium]|nr:PT domain-containing protein [Clostridia bacterium]
MNRNFIKISVSIVALLLALAFCMTGCKVDDVAADIGTAKDEIAANKADAAKALEEATKALEEKIAANETDCAAEIAAVNAAIAEAQKASDASDAALETAIADAKAALNTAIKAVQADLEAAKTALSDKIAANTAELNEEIAALVAALENIELAYQAADLELAVAVSTYIDECYATLEAAIAVVAGDVDALTEYVEDAVEALEADIAAGNKNLLDSIAAVNNAITLAQAKAETADAALKEALEQAIADASKAIVEAVDVIKEDLQSKIDTLNESVSTIDNTVSVTIAGQIKDINDAIDAINADTTLADAIDAVEADIEALYTTIATYQQTTEEVVKAWHEIYTTYQLWEQVNVSYGDMYVLDAEGNKVPVDVAAEYASAQVRLYRALNLEEVNTVKAAFFAVIRNVKSDTLDMLNAIYANLVAAEEGLAAEAIDLKAVRTSLDAADLSNYAEAKLIVDGKVVDLHVMSNNLWTEYNKVRVAVVEDYLEAGNLEAARAGILDLVADGEDASELIADYNAKRVAIVETLIADLDAALGAAESLEALEEAAKGAQAVGDAYTALENDTDIAVEITDLENLEAKMAVVEENYVLHRIKFAKAGIEAAVVVDDLADDKAILDGITATTATIEAKLEEAYAAYYSKYVLIHAADLTADMNAYIDNLAAIYADYNDADNDAIGAIRADYVAFVDNRDLAEAFRVNAENDVLKALAEAEVKFVAVENQLLALEALVPAGEAVAAILGNEEFDEITGTKSEFTVLKDYKTQAAAWVVELDALYADFTDNEANKAAYDEIRTIVDEAGYNTINTLFEAEIADLMDAADAVTNAISTLEAAVADGIKLTTVEDVEAAQAAVNTWIGLATDPDGVAFILEWRSNGELTHEMLIKTVNARDTQYKAYLKTAQDAWTACYTAEYQALTVDNIKYDETALTAVREWFTTYGVITAAYAAEHGLTGIGTDVEEANLAALEAQLVIEIAERQALVADLASQAAALQGRIDALGNVTTDSKDTVAALRVDYDAWVKACADNNVAQSEENGTVVDAAALVAAEAKLDQIRNLGMDIATGIADLRVPELGTDPATPYFADAAAQEAYAAEVEAIVEKLAEYEELNDGYRGNFSEDLLKKVADCQLYADKYTALVKLNNAYVAIDAQATDATVKAELANYLNNTRATVDAIDSATANAAAVIGFYGNQAEADMLEIANNAGDPGSGSSGVTTEAPTAAPTEAPTAAPTEEPTAAPTEAPTAAPTEAPTEEPTEAPLAPVETTIDFSTTDQRKSLATEQQIWVNGDITFTHLKAESTTNIADYSNPIRLYKSSSITISAYGTITKIVFNVADSNYNTIEASIGTVSGATVTVDGLTITVEFAEGVGSFTIDALTAQNRLNSIVVTYVPACAHANKTTTTVEADCTTAGSITVTCDDCGNTVSETKLEALGHTGGEATCEEKAVCTVCGESYGSLAAHSYVAGICSVCGKEESTVTVVNYVLKATASNGTAYYWDGTASGGTGAMTTDAASAAVLTMETVDGGVYVYYTDATGAKQYITIGTANKGFGVSTTATVLNYNSENGYVYANDRYIASYGVQDIRTYKESAVTGTNMYFVMTVVE